MEQMLANIIKQVSNTRGDAFFQSITLALHRSIGADFTFVASLDKDQYCSNTLALAANDQIVDNISYSLAHTPCANVADNSVCCYRNNVCATFPDDFLLVEMGIEGYLGTPLHNLQDEVIGIIVALYKRPIEDEAFVLDLFALFSGRIEAELDRLAYEKRLEQANELLETKVAQRTGHLDKTINELQKTQQQLVESEKMAALGNMVAGLAHEVNTPLGVAITSQSVLKEQQARLAARYESGELTTEELDEFLTLSASAMKLMEDNLRRAADLVESFKRTAADQHCNDYEQINLADYYHQIVTAMQPMLKSVHAKVQIDIPPDWNLMTLPSVHSQTLINLLSNSVMHGFTEGNNNQIDILGENIDGEFYIRYRDNGKGLTEDARKRIFEPFFTTARSQGGIGLGMNIVFNLVTHKLGGTITLPAQANGFALDIHFRPQEPSEE